ncbi:hypothetical protein [uncultured Aquimarina sp.]|uniref:hypothetical protein n=1 Tax=uncultured Aquimarina sp. TaxID=575652 RepID=UPI0026305AA6|nr:hypothetical protein [uncultured Aquimarina sp.]
MKKRIQLILVLLSVIVLSSCNKDDDSVLENTMEIDGQLHYINGGFIDGAHVLNDDLTWDFASIITLYGDGINYDPRLARFTGRGFVIRMKMHSSIHGLQLGNYSYSESGEPLTFNEAGYTTNFDVDSDQNELDAIIVSGSMSVARQNEHTIHFNLTDSEGRKIIGHSEYYMF